jgi:hypothetical protein
MAAICTSTETFKIKHAENTNTFFVMRATDENTSSVEGTT